MSIQSTNPATNEVVQIFEEMSETAIEQSIATSEETFATWRKTPFSTRAALLHNVAGLLRKKKKDLAKLITLEMGKLVSQAEGEIKLSAEIFDYYANNAEAFLQDKILNPIHGQALIRHTPIGVLLGVQPWNFPFYQVARFAAPNIMVGNTILIKHASIVPQCAIAIEELFLEAGAPLGLYTNLLVSGKRASEMVADTRIKGVSLTVLELGGSDAFIVLEDADIDQAVEWAVVGRINNNGECCIASKRFIAVENIAEEFFEKLKNKLVDLVIGDPFEASTQLGPLSSEEAAIKIADQVKRAVDGGAKILLGGKRVDRSGAYMEATVLTNMLPDNPVYFEEFFGPVAVFLLLKMNKRL
jgi:succinate-semialdehyde dehydrogenase/glutarate-semialdehyde dehydrogenase